MKKKLVFMTVFCLLVSMLLTGCESNLRKKIEREKRRSEIKELDLSTVFDEENGYHHPALTWGMNIKEADAALLNVIDKMTSIGEDNSAIYNIAVINLSLNGRVADSASMTADSNNICYMYSLMFDGSKRQESEETQMSFFTSYEEKLSSAFGEATDHTVEEHEIASGTKATYDTYIWEYVTKDGKVTQIQWSAAFLYGTEEPDYLSFGFVWLNGEQ